MIPFASICDNMGRFSNRLIGDYWVYPSPFLGAVGTDQWQMLEANNIDRWPDIFVQFRSIQRVFKTRVKDEVL
jgi:hypothetical protein